MTTIIKTILLQMSEEERTTKNAFHEDELNLACLLPGWPKNKNIC